MRRLNENGVALILVISSISMLTLMMVDFSYNTQINLRISKNFQNVIKAQYLARSGVYFAALELKIHSVIKKNPLVKQIPGYSEEMVDKIWQFGFIYPPIASKKASFGVQKEINELVEESKIEGKINVQIFDETSKINLNDLENTQMRAAIIQQLDSIFEQKKTSDDEFFRKYRDLKFTELINNIVDWIDKDNNKVDGGDEESYYGKLAHPYKPKNAPLDTVSELALIEGFNDDTIFDLLLPHITVYPTGGINVNSADKTMLLTISPELTDEDVTQIIEQRTKNGYFKTAQEFENFCKNTLLKSANFNTKPNVKLSVTTSVFSIESIAEVGGVTQTVRAVVDASKFLSNGQPQITYWNLN